VAGPGTYFDQETASVLGAPKKVDLHLQQNYVTTIIDFPNYTINDLSSLSSIVNRRVYGVINKLPQYNALPIKNNLFNIRAEYVRERPSYIITIYYNQESDKKSNQRAALNWFKENDINTVSQSILFEYLQKATDE
jgi:hypothetical protein